MAQNKFIVESGFRIEDENTINGIDIVQGIGSPVGVLDSDVGSVYVNRSNGHIWTKIAAGNTSWRRGLNTDDQVPSSWRPEKVVVVTNEAAIADDTNRNLTTTPFTDDDTPFLTAADFTVGDYIIFGANGTPVLKKVTVVSSPNIQVNTVGVTALGSRDTFVADNYLPDTPNTQESKAVVLYNGSVIVKIADINWNIADGINMASGYTATNGTITSSDTVNSAIEKLDGNQQDIQTTLGVAQGAVNLGTFTGTTIPDSQTVKQALQSLETAFEGLGIVNSENEAVTTAVTLDSVLVDSAYAVKWYVHGVDETNNTMAAWEVWAAHNGEAGADATTVDSTTYAKLKKGALAGASVTVDLNGTGASQVMRLRVAATNTTKYRAKRIPVIDVI